MDQKLENLLNLALETSEAERMHTEDLNVGYDEAARSWELIVKYSRNIGRSGSADEAEGTEDVSGSAGVGGSEDASGAGSLHELEKLGIQVEYLIAGYAILTVPEALVKAVSEFEQIEYVEKPKRYYYSVDGGGFLSGPTGEAGQTGKPGQVGVGFAEGLSPTDRGCFGDVMFGPPGLTGEGVLIAVLDSGIDWRRREFRNADGSTRILSLWDQTLKGQTPPEGFAIGGEFSEEQINEALRESGAQEQFIKLPSLDAGGHGTAVAGIAAGALQGIGYLGAAPRAGLLVVKLGLPDANGFPRTTEIMRAVTWALRKAGEMKRPLAVNLSFGNSYGAHDGSSLLERFLDSAAQIGRTVICVGSGNEGASGGHVAGNVLDAGVTHRAVVELAVGEYERSLRVQLWQDYSDVYRIFLRSPGGQESELTAPVGGGKFTLVLEQTRILAYQGEPAPYAAAKELYFEMLPMSGNYINGGVWQITVLPVRALTGQYYLYLSDSASRNGRTQFYNPSPQATFTVPSTAAGVITVGAYDPTYDAYADFSGRGREFAGGAASPAAGLPVAGAVKPDIVAAGVNILAPDTYGGYLPVTGTSFATPIVTGAAALLMEWGIVRGNDPFLYGDKLKAYLRKGAEPLRGIERYPDARVGWGKLCVRDSLPG